MTVRTFAGGLLLAVTLCPLSSTQVRADAPAATQPTSEPAATQPMATTQPSAATQADAPTTAPSTQPVAINLLTPRGTVKTFQAAYLQSDSETLGKAIEATTDEQKKVVVAFAAFIGAQMSLQNALLEKFPPPDRAVPTPAQILKQMLAQIDSTSETITGDEATVSKDGKVIAQLKRVDGEWRVPFASIFGNLPDPGHQIQEFNLEASVFTPLAADVRADKFKSRDEVKAAFQQRIMEAAMKAKPPTTTQPTTTPSTQP